jgi:hypothetical protein
MRTVFIASLALLMPSLLPAQDEPAWSLSTGLTEYVVKIDGKPFAQYRWKDGDIRRPFLYHLHAPDGAQVTRNHPPIAGADATDHDTFHPGLWLSFGDLNGQDYWRNKARAWKESEVISRKAPLTLCEHLVLFDSEEKGEEGWHENCLQFHTRAHGYLLLWKAQFRSRSKAMVFGDQEEMGLGVRMATELTVKAGGTIRDSEGRADEKGVWGQSAKWCAYYRTFKDAKGKMLHRGIAIFPDPANFRPCWWHVRDYGLMVANPFGREALSKGEKSRVEVKKGESMALRFGVLLFAQEGGAAPEIGKAYEDFLGMVKK